MPVLRFYLRLCLFPHIMGDFSSFSNCNQRSDNRLTSCPYGCSRPSLYSNEATLSPASKAGDFVRVFDSIKRAHFSTFDSNSPRVESSMLNRPVRATFAPSVRAALAERFPIEGSLALWACPVTFQQVHSVVLEVVLNVRATAQSSHYNTTLATARGGIASAWQ